MFKSINYIVEQFKIQLKGMKEYKTNFYLAILISISVVFASSITMSIMQTNFNSIINWTFEQYYFFIFITAGSTGFSGAFWFGASLKREIIRGNLNTSLTKPINVFLQHLASTSYLFIFVGSFFYLIFLSYTIFFSIENYNILRLIITILFVSLAIILLAALGRFLDSFSFFIKDFENIKTNIMHSRTVFDTYPATMFSGKLLFFAMIFPNVYYSAYATEFLFGQISYTELFILTKYILTYLTICIIGLIINWHYGLKKYEAFG